jgi:hypothetical protein
MNKLWIVGCSIAHGVGVGLEQRWGQLVSDCLKLPATFLTAEGSSIEWAADQILQADINSEDTVLWGLTTPNRFMWYDDLGNVQHILNVYYQNHPEFQIVDKKVLVDLTLAYKAVNYVKQVQRYLDQVDCKYAIGHILPGLDEHRQILLNNLNNTQNFFIAYNTELLTASASNHTTFLTQSRPVNNIFVDTGTDGFHPGPLQHIIYADQFLKMVNL